MNKAKLCQIVEQYKDHLVQDTLYISESNQVCILGACLIEAGVPKQHFPSFGSSADELFGQFGYVLEEVGIESLREVKELIEANDDHNFGFDDDDGDEDHHTEPYDNLRTYLACKDI